MLVTVGTPMDGGPHWKGRPNCTRQPGGSLFPAPAAGSLTTQAEAIAVET